MKNIIEGSDLMIFAEIGTGSTPVSLAFATNCTLSISTETTSVTSKDHGTALWNTSTIKSLSWEATSENLYSDEVNNGYDALFEKMTNREGQTEKKLHFILWLNLTQHLAIQLILGLKAQADTQAKHLSLH